MRSEAVNKAMQNLAIINEFLEDLNDQDDRALAEISQDVFDARAFMIKNDPDYREAAALLMAGEEPDFSPTFLSPDALDALSYAFGKTQPIDFGGLEMRVIGSLSEFGEYLRGRINPLGTVTGRLSSKPPETVDALNREEHIDFLMRIDRLAPKLVFTIKDLSRAYDQATHGMTPHYQFQTDAGRDKIAKRVVELLQMAEPDLHSTTDAVVWAKEFMKKYMSQFRYDDAESFEATMVGWFANAIETGRNFGRKEAEGRDRGGYGDRAVASLLNKRLEDLRHQVEVASDPGNAHANEYMRGMANGAIMALATMTDNEPQYIEPAKRGDVDSVLQALHSYWKAKRGGKKEKSKALISLNREMLDAYEEYLEKVKSNFETDRVEGQATMYHRGSDSFYEVQVIRRLDNTNLNLTTAFNEGLIGNHRLMLLGDTFSERAIAEARVVIEDGNLIKNNYAPKRQSHLFNDHDGTRGSTLVSLTFAQLYRIIHDKLSTLRAPGNVADFFDIDAKCQQICVAIEEAMGTYPNSPSLGAKGPGRKSTSKLPALEEALKEWLGETALSAHGWSNGAPRLGKHEAEELFRRATDYFGTHRF